MATMDSLLASGVLSEIALRAVSAPKRRLYATEEFTAWLDNSLPNLEAGRLQSDHGPSEQVFFRFHQWISGKCVQYNRQFNDLMPVHHEVWELKTVDTRMFGWMYRPLEFIAVFGDYADMYKPPNITRSYDEAVRRVVGARNALDLDEPKFSGGTFDELVCV